MQAAPTWSAVASAPSRSRPWSTYILMLAVIGVMMFEVLIFYQNLDLAGFQHSFGLVSADFSWTDPQSWVTLLTYNFLHSGGRHFAGNALVMLFAGVAVEKYVGWRSVGFIWLAGGVAGGLAHLFVVPDSARALVGASGAISALLGAAIVIGWRWALPVKLWRGRRTLFHIRLPVVTGIWVAFQLSGVVLLYNGSIANPTVATWVHVAGFAFGALVAGAITLRRNLVPGPDAVLIPSPSSGD